VVSPTGLRSVWLRTGLQTFRLRLTALEKKVAEEAIVLTERQVAEWQRWSANAMSKWIAARSRLPIRGTLDPKTPSMSAT